MRQVFNPKTRLRNGDLVQGEAKRLTVGVVKGTFLRTTSDVSERVYWVHLKSGKAYPDHRFTPKFGKISLSTTW